MKSFKTYLEENKKSNWMLGAALAGSAALFAGGLAKHHGMFSGSDEPQSQEAPAAPTVAPQQQPTIQPQTTSTPNKKQSIIHHDVIKNMVIEDEGIRTKMYKDTKGIPTIGIGHNLQASNSKSTFIKAFGDQGLSLHQQALRGGSLSHDQARKLFDIDYEHHLNQALKLTPNLAEHHPLVQASIVSGTYRGHWGGSPKARELFNQGDYHRAANELLDNEEYRASKDGVRKRMDRDAKHIREFGPVGNIRHDQ